MLAPTAAACRPAEGGRARAREAGEPVVQLFLRLNRMRGAHPFPARPEAAGGRTRRGQPRSRRGVGVDYFQKLELKLAPLSLMVEESLVLELHRFVAPLLGLPALADPAEGEATSREGWEWRLVAPAPRPLLERQVESARDRARSREIARDRSRSPEIARDRSRSPEAARDLLEIASS